MSTDIRVVAFMRAKTGEEATVRAAILACAQKSAKEKGNLAYTADVALNDPRLFVITEHWRDEEARKRHLRSEHFLMLKHTVDEEQRLSEHTFTVLSPMVL